jgi:hypothetical protein
MAKKILPLRPRQKEGVTATPKPPKGLSLANITVRHTVGDCTTTVRGPELAQLIEATRGLYDPTERGDFTNATSIAIELRSLADVLLDLMDDDRPSALGYLSDQLRRLAHRVSALDPRSVNQQPDWYTVEVTK